MAASAVQPIPANVAGTAASAARPAAPRGTAQSPAPTPSSRSGRTAAPVSRPTPAATVQVAGIPASVAADDRTEYRLLLRQFGGNMGAALAALNASEASEKGG